MTDTPLSPCPICGGAPVRNGRGTSGGVLCWGKDVPGLMHRLQVYGDGQADADATWNHRAENTWEATRQKAIEDINHIGRIMNLMLDRYLGSRAGDAGKGLSDDAPTPADALAMIEQEISFWPEGSRARTAATRCRNIVRAMICALSATPAPAVDAVPAGEVERLQEALGQADGHESQAVMVKCADLRAVLASLSHGKGQGES